MNNLVSVQCPHCWEQLEIELEYQESQQTFVEDCHVCCRPIQFQAHYDAELGHFICQGARE